MPLLSEEERQEKDDELKSSKGYRLLIGGVCFVFIVLLWRALLKLNWRLLKMRQEFWPTMKRILIAVCILFVVFMAIILIINLFGKQKERDEHGGM